MASFVESRHVRSTCMPMAVHVATENLAMLVVPQRSVASDALLIRHVILARIRLVDAVRVVRVPVPRAADARSAPAGTPCASDHPHKPGYLKHFPRVLLCRRDKNDADPLTSTRVCAGKHLG